MVVMDVKRLIPARDIDLYDVVNPQGEDLGQVQNFMVDPETGRIAFLIVSFGGILGLTDKWIAIPLEILRWNTESGKFVMDVPRETLEHARGLDKDRWRDEIDLSWMEEVYTCFGCKPYWDSGTRWILRGAGGEESLVVSAAWLKGHEIKNMAGETIGKIDDMIIDLQTGYMTYALADLDKYESLKGKKVAIPVEAFTVSGDSKMISLDLDREKLEHAPVYDPEHTDMDYGSVGAVYAYYGYSPYWNNRRIWRRRGTPARPVESMTSYRPFLYQVSDLLGDPVRDIQGKDVGTMEDLMIDLETGFLASAILSHGGLVGVGEKYYPLPLEVLSFDPDKKVFYLSVDREILDEAPAFEKDRLPRIDRQGLIDIYAAYGYTPYWRERQAHRM